MKIKTNPQLTAIIIAHNEELMLSNCLDCLKFCGQIIVIDNNSTDKTVEIAQRASARTLSFSGHDFAQMRNFAAAHVKTEWLMYVDADERITPYLAQEINSLINDSTHQFTAAEVKRQNYLYGHHFKATGYDRDRVIRLFKKKHLVEWVGQVHESPIYSGEYITLQEPLLHLTHRSTKENLLKSASWTAIEAELLTQSIHTKKVTKFTLLKKSAAEFYRRYFRDQGYQDGMPGFIESLVQAMNKTMIYIQVWELQQKPPIPNRYQKIDQKLHKDWSKIDWNSEN